LKKKTLFTEVPEFCVKECDEASSATLYSYGLSEKGVYTSKSSLNYFRVFDNNNNLSSIKTGDINNPGKWIHVTEKTVLDNFTSLKAESKSNWVMGYIKSTTPITCWIKLSLDKSKVESFYKPENRLASIKESRAYQEKAT
jgi:hypothetical protein